MSDDEELIARLRNYGHVGTVLEAAARIEALVKENIALKEHVADMLAEQECGCGYDKPTDVCLGHLPLHRKTMARAERLEAAVAILEDALQEAGDDYPGSSMQQWCQHQVKAARAALRGDDHD